ncbi:putative phospholipase B-like 2 isoform X2 [Lingula anatina]|uniref:Phospholipase B-like n=1 Tax=Lingula anatina TaxID=7574 RepID=A0A1S3H3H8_LINAN|nr:putative phospholipase B-like 2 isoform X2 [Lingula anatina]|eukprot:XP_013380031.1 putative phospholipase B-like 2 isoform X2 [Lingula anatina]
MAMGNIGLSLLFVLHLSFCTEFIYIKYDIHTDLYFIETEKPPADWIAYANFSNEINSTGWSYLEVTTNPAYPDFAQAYSAGLAEGYITRQLIAMHWNNTVQGYCDPESPSDYCKRLADYVKQNLAWVNDKINKPDNSPEDKVYWHQVDLFLKQVSGLQDGYENKPAHPSINLDPFQFLMFQIAGDIEDLEEALHKPDKSRALGSGSCSALVKLLPGNKDLYVSHDTWSSFQSMLRILKKYDFGYKIQDSGPLIPGKVMTFSSYPGVIYSGDDYYLISSGLVSQETTIGNNNDKLWKYVKPTYSVLEGIRTMVANRLATSIDTWAQIFSRYNSGTYNNQWMIVDYTKFKPGQTPSAGLFGVVEQIPNMVKYADMTRVLTAQSYWPSYNIPYFQEVFEASGWIKMVEKYGDWFSYNKTARANIFRRDHVKVKDINSMIALMRYNDYQHDPLSRCNCTPPYSAENAISARCDLNPANGSYPIKALGHRSHGGTDMKLTNSEMFKSLQFVAISGPTFDSLPPFQWSKTDFEKIYPHVGHPDLWQFKPVVHQWKLT